MSSLQENSQFTQRELAKELGICVGGPTYRLKALMEKGLVRIKSFATSKKFGYVYMLTVISMAEKVAITHQFLQRKMDKYGAFKYETSENDHEMIVQKS